MKNENDMNTERAVVANDALFAVGDVVFHKTAGTKGIIRSQDMKCVNPSHAGKQFACCSLSTIPDPNPCHYAPSGSYTVSVDFGIDTKHVEGFLLSAND
jgi:hypothetical protein